MSEFSTPCIEGEFNRTSSTQGDETTVAGVNDGPYEHRPTFTYWSLTTTTTEDSSQDTLYTSSWQLFVQCFVLVLGLIGTAGNIFVIFVLTSKKGTSKKSINLLILNQLSVDMYSCVCLVVTYAYKLRNVYLGKSTVDVVVCMLLDSEMLLWFGLNSSPASLFFIAAERYAKIVHPLLHRQYFRSWMTYGCIAITWINGIVLTAPVTVITTMITSGRCNAYLAWPSTWHQISFGIYYFLWDYLGPALIFVYCYWHIAAIIRRRVNGPQHPVKQEHEDASAKAANQKVASSARGQIAGIQTVVTIALLFIFCWLPNQIYFLLMNLNYGLSQLTDAWYGTLAIAFITICVHPFIYAGKIDGLWKYAVSLIRRPPAVHPTPTLQANEEPPRPGVSSMDPDHLDDNSKV